jgi:NADH-quinone oxidoreductase subunit D
MQDIFAPQAPPRYELDDNDLLIDVGPPAKYSGAHVTETYKVNMGPQHPSTHGVLRLELTMDGEVVKQVRPHIGYLHRCFEKHAENLPYPEIMPFTDRMDYIAGISQNMGLALAVERMLGIKVCDRVEYIRVLCCELQRIASHLVALGTFGLDMGAFTPFLWAFRDRERILDLLEWLSGARMLYNYIWIGGLPRDLPEGWTEKTRQFLRYFEPKIKDLNDILSSRLKWRFRMASPDRICAVPEWTGISGATIRIRCTTVSIGKSLPVPANTALRDRPGIATWCA